MPETKRADEIVPGDVIALSRMTRAAVVELPPSERHRTKQEGVTVLAIRVPGRMTILEMTSNAEAEQIADGSWWF